MQRITNGIHTRCKAAHRRWAAFIVYVMVAFCSGMLSTSTVCTAQTSQRAETQTLLNTTDCSSFDHLLHVLSEKNNTIFIVEGNYSEQKPSLALIALLTKPVPPLTLSKIVEKLAGEYDYTSSCTKNVFRLTKNYSKPNDLPNVTLAECALSLQSVLKSYSPFIAMPGGNPDNARDTAKNLLLNSFSQDQWKRMGTSGGLSFDQLNQDQPNLLNNYNLSSHYEYDLHAVHRYSLQVAGTQSKPIAFYYTNGKRYKPTLAGKVVFGCDASSVIGTLFFVPLSHPNELFVNSYGVATFSTSDKKIMALMEKPDPTIPKETEAPSPPPSPDTKTVGEIVEQLNVKAGSPNPARYEVHEAYATKPVTIIGGEKASPEEILRAIADVYGLRLVHTREGQFQLRPPAVRPARNPTELPAVVTALMPAPLFRAWQANTTIMVPQNSFASKNQQMRQRSETLYAAVRRLRMLADPKIKEAKNHRVLLADLGPEADRALANVLMIRASPSLLALLNQSPDYIVHPENIVLTGGLSTSEAGQKKASLFINIKNPDGTLSPRAGF